MLTSQFPRNVFRYWFGGSLYVIRDVWQRDPEREIGRRLVRCEYAVRNPNGSKRWLRCAEGVDFADIAPLRTRRLDG